MKLLDVKKLVSTKKISSERIQNILKHVDFFTVNLNDVNVCDNYKLVYDDVYIYNDILSNTDENNINNIKVFIQKHNKIKNKKNIQKTKYICFKKSSEQMKTRPIKQQLADISTNTITQNLRDKDYEAFIFDFYTSMNIVITKYTEMRKLRIPDDICFFYKGGNVFRILLNDIVHLLGNKEYLKLMRRSDADFQIFINPSISNYDKIYNEIYILATFVLYSMKSNLQRGDYNFTRTFGLYKHKMYDDIHNIIKHTKLHSNIIDRNESIKIDILSRKDYIIESYNFHGEDNIIYKESESILNNIQKIPSSQFYISKNSTIKFVGNASTNEFDLLRMKMNIVLQVPNNNIKIPIPSEVIDVSIPKKDDSKLRHLADNASKYIVKYVFKNGIFEFWAPSLQYMISDVDHILFIQNQFPWHDKKSIKRVQRYFLSILMLSIISKSDNNILERVNSYKNELTNLVKLLKCINDNITCDSYVDGSIYNMFYKKYATIFKNINSIKSNEEKRNELLNMRTFNVEVIAIIQNLIKDMRYLISKTTDERFIKFKKRLQSTIILG